MNRTEFDALRNIAGKSIEEDIKFTKSKAMSPLLTAENIRIINAHGLDVRLTIHYNPKVGSKTFNVHVPGVGPICRLDVDGPAHRPAGRSHKHSLQTERCPDRNLPDKVADRPDLSGKGIRELFGEFCKMANMSHIGNIDAPDDGGRWNS